MPELSHDTADDGFHEIQLSGKQLVFLAMAGTVVLTFTFICGVLVGKNVRAQGEDLPATAAIATNAPATADGTPDTSVAVTEPPTPPIEDELTYHDRLEGSLPPDSLKKPTARQAQSQTPAPPAVEEGPPPAPPETKPATRPEAPAPAERPAGAVPTSGRPGRWVVQVTALSSQDRANTVASGLIAKGYPAFVVPPQPGTPRLYRVQVGRYANRSEADGAAKRLRSEGNYRPEVKR